MGYGDKGTRGRWEDSSRWENPKDSCCCDLSSDPNPEQVAVLNESLGASADIFCILYSQCWWRWLANEYLISRHTIMNIFVIGKSSYPRLSARTLTFGGWTRRLKRQLHLISATTRPRPPPAFLKGRRIYKKNHREREKNVWDYAEGTCRMLFLRVCSEFGPALSDPITIAHSDMWWGKARNGFEMQGRTVLCSFLNAVYYCDY